MASRRIAEAPTGSGPAQAGSSFWSNLLAASLPAAVLFLVLPVELYLPNQGEFDYKLMVLLPYPLFFALWVLVWAALFLFLRPGRRTAIAAALVWCGLFLLLSDIVAPVQLSLLDGTQQQPDEPLGLTAREIALAAAILLAAWKTPRSWARQLGLSFATLLLLFQPIRVWRGASPATHYNKYDAEFESHPPPTVLSSKPNLYHITWDAHDSHSFEKSLQDSEIAVELDGFIFFKENQSNYAWTAPSVASYMTGTFYKEGSMAQWAKRRLRTGAGVTGELHQAGFEVWNYVPNLYHVVRWASHAATNLGMMAEGDPLVLVANFADLWLVRAVPNFLQDEVYFKGKGLFSRMVPVLGPLLWARPPAAAGEQESRLFYSVQLARRLIQEEKLRPARGQYVYAHIYLPHPPFVLNEECEYAPQADSFQKPSDFSFVTTISTDEVTQAFYRQSGCANKLMVEFIRELKRLGRYEKSAIIFHSDHTRTFEKIWRNADHTANNREPQSAIELDNTARALLLIKPPGRAGVPLEISERPTQLVDLPATIYDMEGITPSVLPEEGQSVLARDFPLDRESHLFLGYTQIDDWRRRITLGKDFQEGELIHFSYTPSVGWKRYPNLPVTWGGPDETVTTTREPDARVAVGNDGWPVRVQFLAGPHARESYAFGNPGAHTLFRTDFDTLSGLNVDRYGKGGGLTLIPAGLAEADGAGRYESDDDRDALTSPYLVPQETETGLFMFSAWVRPLDGSPSPALWLQDENYTFLRQAYESMKRGDGWMLFVGLAEKTGAGKVRLVVMGGPPGTVSLIDKLLLSEVDKSNRTGRHQETQ